MHCSACHSSHGGCVVGMLHLLCAAVLGLKLFAPLVMPCLLHRCRCACLLFFIPYLVQACLARLSPAGGVVPQQAGAAYSSAIAMRHDALCRCVHCAATHAKEHVVHACITWSQHQRDILQQQTQPVGRLLAAAATAQHLRSMSAVGAPVPILAAQGAAIPCCKVWLGAAGLLRCSSTAATAASVLVTGWQQGVQMAVKHQRDVQEG